MERAKKKHTLYTIRVKRNILFAWFFTYMPVGKGAVTKLIARPEQREMIYHKIREYRHTKLLFTVDFWNDGEYVGGCIAGGRQIMDGCGRSSSSGICSIWYF